MESRFFYSFLFSSFVFVFFCFCVCFWGGFFVFSLSINNDSITQDMHDTCMHILLLCFQVETYVHVHAKHSIFFGTNKVYKNFKPIRIHIFFLNSPIFILMLHIDVQALIANNLFSNQLSKKQNIIRYTQVTMFNCVG